MLFVPFSFNDQYKYNLYPNNQAIYTESNPSTGGFNDS